MKNLWGPITADQWRSTPFVAERPATEEDVAAGRAVFYVPSGSTAAKLELPCCAVQTLEDGSTQFVVVIQAEMVSGGTTLGVRPLDGGNGVCTDTELKLLPHGFPKANDR
jgi:hypothetical protein